MSDYGIHPSILSCCWFVGSGYPSSGSCGGVKAMTVMMQSECMAPAAQLPSCPSMGWWWAALHGRVVSSTRVHREPPPAMRAAASPTLRPTAAAILQLRQTLRHESDQTWHENAQVHLWRQPSMFIKLPMSPSINGLMQFVQTLVDDQWWSLLTYAAGRLLMNRLL